MRLVSCPRLLLVLLAIISLVLASNISPLFVVQPGPLSTGGCDAYGATIASSYTEAIDMFTKAKAAIQNLQTTKAKSANPQDWDSQGQAVFPMFNLRMAPSVGLVPPGPNELGNKAVDLNAILTAYENILAEVDEPNPANKKKIACGNQGVAYIAPNDKDPRQAAQFDDNTNNNQWPTLNAGNDYPDGALFSPPDMIYKLPPGLPKVVSEYICQQNVFGTTMREWDTIFLCPFLFQGNWVSTSSAADAESIVSGNGIDQYRLSVPFQFAHELVHLWNPSIDDQVAVDTTTGVQPNPKGPLIPKVQGQTEATYGFMLCVYLSYCYPQEALENADSFAIFALMMYFDKWSWATGRAVAKST